MQRRRVRPGTMPPRFFDPRRVGALAGLIGARAFVFSYTDQFGDGLELTAKVAFVALAVVTLWFLFVRPRWLGEFRPPKAWAVGVYVLCVVGEVALIRVGTDWLAARDLGELRPALIVMVVGLHFVPFAWAFQERMFVYLGAALLMIGGLGLLLDAPRVTATMAGFVMTIIVLAYSLGAFVRKDEDADERADAAVGVDPS